MQQKSFPYGKQLREAIRKWHRKAALYLNAKTAHWDKRAQLLFLTTVCLAFITAILGLLLTGRGNPRMLPQIRQPPVQVQTDTLTQHFHLPQKTITK